MDDSYGKYYWKIFRSHLQRKTAFWPLKEKSITRLTTSFQPSSLLVFESLKDSKYRPSFAKVYLKQLIGLDAALTRT